MESLVAAVCFAFGLYCPGTLEMPPQSAPPPEPSRPAHVVVPAPAPPPAPSLPARPQRPSHFPEDCPVQPPADYGAIFVAASLRYPSLGGGCFLAKQANKECPLSRRKFCLTAESHVTPPAIGPAQFLQTTADDLGIDPTDPVQAFHGMAKYGKWCEGQWNRRGRTDVEILILRLICYNWGLGNELDSQEREGWYAGCDARRHSPAESRNYVDVILDNPCSG